MKDELKRVYLFFLRKLSTFNELEFNEKDIDSFLRRLGKKMDLVPLGEQFAWDTFRFSFGIGERRNTSGEGGSTLLLGSSGRRH